MISIFPFQIHLLLSLLQVIKLSLKETTWLYTAVHLAILHLISTGLEIKVLLSYIKAIITVLLTYREMLQGITHVHLGMELVNNRILLLWFCTLWVCSSMYKEVIFKYSKVNFDIFVITQRSTRLSGYWTDIYSLSSAFKVQTKLNI